MRGINKVILVGIVGMDPEYRVMSNGKGVCNLSIATSERWRDANGETQEKTEWHKITCFERLADICSQYVHKGSKVYIEGSLTTRKWQDKQTGADRYTTEIKAQVIQMLDSKKDNDQQEPQPQQQAPRQSGRNEYAEATGRKAQAPAPSTFDDDPIPF